MYFISNDYTVMFLVVQILIYCVPRSAAIVFIVAALIQYLPFPGTGLLFGVAVALLGFFALAGGRMSEA